jgi:hypothetical protein
VHHHRLGDDPRWALYHQRERLAFTDPPAPPPPRPHHRSRRGVSAVLAALAIIAVLRADTTTLTQANLGGHSGFSAPRTGSAPKRRVATTWRVHRHAPLSHQHTKETRS